jgi:hypothetical protein
MTSSPTLTFRDSLDKEHPFNESTRILSEKSVKFNNEPVIHYYETETSIYPKPQTIYLYPNDSKKQTCMIYLVSLPIFIFLILIASLLFLLVR